jgi:hypothetical protein
MIKFIKIVTRPSSFKGKSPVPAQPSLNSKPTSPLPNNDIIVAAMDYNADACKKEINPVQPTHPATEDDLIIVVGTREKRRILNAYEEKFGSGYTNSIVTTKKGKHINTTSDLPNIGMRPSKDKYYQVDTLELHCIIATLLKGYQQEFTTQDLHNLRLVCKTFASMIPKIIRWLKVDFSPLREPRYNNKQQERINPHCIKMARAAMIYFGLDPGKFVRWLEGEYTGHHRDIQTILDAVESHIMAKDFKHMKWILLGGCPAELMFIEPLDNKLAMLKCGNLKTFKDNPGLIKKAMNKEDQDSPLVPINEDICRTSAYCHTTTQTVVIKPGKAD